MRFTIKLQRSVKYPSHDFLICCTVEFHLFNQYNDYTRLAGPAMIQPFTICTKLDFFDLIWEVCDVAVTSLWTFGGKNGITRKVNVLAIHEH